MASCSFWARRLLPPRTATCVHTRHMGLTSWHIPGSGASRGEEGHRTRGKATGQRSKEKGSEVNVHSRSPLRRVNGGQGRGGGHAGSEQDMVSVGPGVPSHPNPVLTSKKGKPTLKGRVLTSGSCLCWDNTALVMGTLGFPPVLRPLEGLPLEDAEARAWGCGWG